MISSEKCLIEKISKYDNIIIYGAGWCANLLVDYLTQAGNADNLVCAAVSDATKNPEHVAGLPVREIYSLMQYKETGLIIVATYTNLHPEIIYTLREAGFKNIDAIANVLIVQLRNLKRNDLAEKYDVGLVGIGYQDNYGGILTNYALYKYLESVSLRLLMIDMPRDMGRTYMFSDYQYGDTVARRFMNKYFTISEVYSNEADIKKLNDRCEMFIVGSDQIWCHAVYCPADYFVFLSFVKEHKKKIAYASSFGHDVWHGSEQERARASYNLSTFDGISVREESGVGLLTDTFAIADAELVLDPVFICPGHYFDELIANSKVCAVSDYIFSYIIDPDESKRAAILCTQEKLGFETFSFVEPRYASKFAGELRLENTYINASVEDFMYYAKNAKFVITDSYHGVCFAIIFKKDFICIGNERRGLTRFVSLLKMVGLTERMILNPREITEKEYLFDHIDFCKVHETIEKLREKSTKWLNYQLKKPKAKSIASLYEMLDERCNELEKELTESKEQQKQMVAELEEIKKLLQGNDRV